VQVLLGVIAVCGTLALVIGAVTGRVRMRSCCVDPEHDLRMRDGN